MVFWIGVSVLGIVALGLIVLAGGIGWLEWIFRRRVRRERDRLILERERQRIERERTEHSEFIRKLDGWIDDERDRIRRRWRG